MRQWDKSCNRGIGYFGAVACLIQSNYVSFTVPPTHIKTLTFHWLTEQHTAMHLFFLVKMHVDALMYKKLRTTQGLHCFMNNFSVHSLCPAIFCNWRERACVRERQTGSDTVVQRTFLQGPFWRNVWEYHCSPIMRPSSRSSYKDMRVDLLSWRVSDLVQNSNDGDVIKTFLAQDSPREVRSYTFQSYHSF